MLLLGSNNFLSNSNSNIPYLNTIGFKAQSLWCRAQIKWMKSNLIKCRFLRRRENRRTRGKTSRSREENQQTQPTYDTKSGNQTRATLVGGECSHHYATTTPPLLPQTGTLLPPSIDNICWEELRVLFLNPPCLVLVGFSSNWTTLLPSALWKMETSSTEAL